MTRPRIICPTCHSSGTILLGDAHFETLQKFKHQKQWTAPGLHKVATDGVTVGAINNRMEDLRKLGFLGRTRSGKVWIYFRTGKRLR